jgi:hypothetical protein
MDYHDSAKYESSYFLYVWQYDWIKNSENPAKNLWPLAIKVSKRVDRGVYRFLFYSECFQCFETTFIISFLAALLYNIYIVSLVSINVSLLIFNGTFLTALLVLHILSRNISMVFAKRFFLCSPLPAPFFPPLCAV